MESSFNYLLIMCLLLFLRLDYWFLSFNNRSQNGFWCRDLFTWTFLTVEDITNTSIIFNFTYSEVSYQDADDLFLALHTFELSVANFWAVKFYPSLYIKMSLVYSTIRILLPGRSVPYMIDIMRWQVIFASLIMRLEPYPFPSALLDRAYKARFQYAKSFQQMTHLNFAG